MAPNEPGPRETATRHIPSVPSPLNPRTPPRRRCSSASPSTSSPSPTSTPSSRRTGSSSGNADLSPTQRLLRQKAAVAWRAVALRNAIGSDGTAQPCPQASCGLPHVSSSPTTPTEMTRNSDEPQRSGVMTSSGNDDCTGEPQQKDYVGEGSSDSWCQGYGLQHHDYDVVFENGVPCISPTGGNEEKKLYTEASSHWNRFFSTFNYHIPSADMENEKEEKGGEDRRLASHLDTYASVWTSYPQPGKRGSGDGMMARPETGKRGGRQCSRRRLVNQRSLVVTSVLCVLGIWSVMQTLRRFSSDGF